MKKQLLLFSLILSLGLQLFAQDQTINGTTFKQDGKVGIGHANPLNKLLVNGDLGIGLLNGTNIGGFTISYLDGGAGTTTFKNNRWGGNIYFKRNSSQGERTQFLFGGSGNHYMNIYNDNNEAKVRFISSGNSYINGGNLGIGTTNPSTKLDVYGEIKVNDLTANVSNKKSNSFGLLLRPSGFASDNRERFQFWKLQSVSRSEWGSGDLAFYSNTDGAGYNEIIRFRSDGNVGIGTTDTHGFKLGVEGKIAAEEVKVATYANWSDFVFNKDYDLPTLKEVEQHIKEKGHLKDIPNADEVKKDGFYLAEMNAKLLQKIEELTLYTIEQEKKLKSQEKQIKDLKTKSQETEEIKERLIKLEKLLINQNANKN